MQGINTKSLFGPLMLLGGFSLLSQSYYKVKVGESAIIFNYLTGLKSAQNIEGYHLKLPFIEKQIIYETKTLYIDEKSQTNNKDLQMVDFQVRVLFKPNPSRLDEIYKNLGLNYIDKLISTLVREVTKTAIAQFTAQELISNREQVSFAIKSNLAKRLMHFNILLDDVSITHLNFSPEYTKKIEDKQIAQQEAERAKFIVEKAKQQKKSSIIKAEANAKSIEIFGKAIKENPSYLVLKKIEYASDISRIIASSRNKYLLNSGNLLMNLNLKIN